jgi:GNAT superfamily N-acetyltransferase
MKPEYDVTKHMVIEPLTNRNWSKFVQLFGERGACGNCWCMLFRLKSADFERGKSSGGNKSAMRDLVRENKPTGILGIYEGEAIAWCAFAPRKDFSKLERSRIHRPIDHEPVWSIPCFFVDKRFRGKGVSVQMLRGIIEYARKKHIRILEAYPTIPTKDKLPDAFTWIGLYKSFKRAGFTIVDRTSKRRPMVRYYTNTS